MNKVIHRESIRNATNLYELFCIIYDDDNISNKTIYFSKIINSLFFKKDLLQMIDKIIFKQNSHKIKKQDLIYILHDIFLNTYKMSKDYIMIDKILKCQNIVRKKCYLKLSTYEGIPENNEDPFTFEKINDIPKKHRIFYKDKYGHVYAFNIIEFEYFIRNNGPWNPYTREKIEDNDVYKMYMYMKMNKISKKQIIEWDTPLQALTELSYTMEKKGFYNDVKWLEKITYSKCLNIICIYNDLSNESDFFSSDFALNEDSYIFDFCREAIKLFKNADENYLLCCNFIKALSMNIDEFYNHIPTWILNIDSPSNYLNNNQGNLYYHLENILNNITNLQLNMTNQNIEIEFQEITFGI